MVKANDLIKKHFDKGYISNEEFLGHLELIKKGEEAKELSEKGVITNDQLFKVYKYINEYNLRVIAKAEATRNKKGIAHSSIKPLIKSDIQKAIQEPVNNLLSNMNKWLEKIDAMKKDVRVNMVRIN